MEFGFPWIALAVLVPLCGAIWVRTLDDPYVARRHALVICILALLFTLGGAIAFVVHPSAGADAPWNVFQRSLGKPAFAIDVVNMPLLPLTALLYVLTALSSLHTRGKRFSYTRMLVSEAIVLALLSCEHHWMLVGLLVAQTIVPWIDIYAAKRPTGVYVLHMSLFVVCLVAGQALVSYQPVDSPMFSGGIVLLTAAIMIRCGVAPLHCWLTDLVEHASLRGSLLFVAPMAGAYAALRLLLPIAPPWALQAMMILSTLTMFYAGGMSLVQRDARRFFCYIFLSNSSLVLIGLGAAAAAEHAAASLAITGALCVWISVGLSLTGFGLTLRVVEARMGKLSLTEFSGLCEQFPNMAALFLVTGLASIGFPGTVGFVGVELLVDGAIRVHPFFGAAIVIGTALNSLAMLHAYFRVFTGKRRTTIPELGAKTYEQLAVMLFVVLIIGGGIYPQIGVLSRYEAANQIVEQRHGGKAEHPAEHAQLVSPAPVSQSSTSAADAVD
jgi:NADH-quinone oxidoreductase subunit M